MKIAIVLGCNIHWAPYYFRYESWLRSHNVEFDVILWNRENIDETVNGGNKIEFNVADVSNDGNPLKIIKFFNFAKFVKKQIKKNNYGKIIFLGLYGCAPTLKAAFYAKEYKDRYWLDIRDYQYEWFKPYYVLEKKIIANAYCVAISSKGFENFLPQHDYVYIHNIDPNMERICNEYRNIVSDKIRISFIGNVRYYDENVALIRHLKNDDRFMLQYFGPGSENIQKYCEENDVKNIRFVGPFKQEQTKDFYSCTDIINNIYGNTSIETLTALSNKLYYSIYLKMPIIVSSETYMEKICSDYGTAIAFEDSDGFADMLYDWYRQYLSSDHDKLYELFRESVETEDAAVQKEFEKFLLN